MLKLFKSLTDTEKDEIRSMKKKLYRRYKTTKEKALKYAREENSDKPIKCEKCDCIICDKCLENLNFQVHADLHSLDFDNEYGVDGNLHIICSPKCHRKFNVETYKLSNGVVSYRKS